MDTNQMLALDTADDLLTQYLDNVSSVHAKTLRVAAGQRAFVDTLRRTAAALRRLAEATRR